MALSDQTNLEEQALLEEIDVSSPSRGWPFRVVGVAVLGVGAVAALASRSTGVGGSIDGLIAMSGGCTNDGDNCMQSRCCNNENSKCFKKNQHWASCNSTCDSFQLWIPEKKQFEKQDEKIWQCDVLLPGTADGASCVDSKFCSQPGSTCYQKNDHWSSCNATCDPYQLWIPEQNQFQVQDSKVWDCHALSPTANGENCMFSKACSQPGSTCYKKNEHWSSCNETCSPKMMWNHDKGVWEETAENVWDCSVEGEAASGDDDAEPAPTPAPTPATSGCMGCGGEQCVTCYTAAIEDCQDEECKDCSGEQCTSCRNDKFKSCCEDVDAPPSMCQVDAPNSTDAITE